MLFESICLWISCGYLSFRIFQIGANELPFWFLLINMLIGPSALGASLTTIYFLYKNKIIK
jgi:hypothetical protein